MESYQIICDSCAAKLKVVNPSLVGRMLACPKCQSMVKVSPPPGGIDDQQIVDDAVGETSSPLSASFDDIDQLLTQSVQQTPANGNSNPTQAGAKSSSRPSKPTKKKTNLKSKSEKKAADEDRPTAPQPPPPKQLKSRRTTGDSASASEHTSKRKTKSPISTGSTTLASGDPQSAISPNQAWDSQSTQAKQKALKVAMMALLLFVLVGVGIIGWIQATADTGSGATAVADADIRQTEIQQTDVAIDSDEEQLETNSNPPLLDNAPGDSDDRGDTDQAATSDSTPQDSDDDKNQSVADINVDAAVQTIADAQAPTIPSAPDAPDSQTATNAVEAKTPPGGPDKTLPATSPRPQRRDGSPSLAQRANGLTNGENVSPPDGDDADGDPASRVPIASLSDLVDSLQGQGKSLTELQDAVAIQKERSQVGALKYYIERPPVRPLDLEKQLSVSVSGLQFKEVNFLSAIADMESISGVPVTFDRVLISDPNVDLTQPVNLKVENTDNLTAFSQLAGALDLGIKVRPYGIVVTESDPATANTKVYPQSIAVDEDSRQQLKNIILQMLSDEDWSPASGHSVDVTNANVELTHIDRVHQKVQSMLTRMELAKNYQQRPTPDTLDQQLLPLALRADELLSKPPGLRESNPFRRRLQIGQFARQVRQSSGLLIFVDWQSMLKLGWTPNLIVPGNIDEPTNQKMLQQLCRALEATYTVSGPDSVIITTFEQAATIRDVEVYSIGDLLEKGISARRLNRILIETIGADQLNQPNTSVFYYGPCKCIVASAPQSVQRQLNSVLNELRTN